MISLERYDIKNSTVFYQLQPDELEKIIIDKKRGKKTTSGALAVNTGHFTGRSPKDRFIVKDALTSEKVWWSPINKAFSEDKFDLLYKKITAYASNRELYVRDSYLSANEKYKTNVRSICELPSSSLFAHNMFLRLKEEDLESFEAEWTIICMPSFEAIPEEDGTESKNFSVINFTKKVIIIGGTAYTGEIKKGMFSVLNFTLPTFENVLPMHCSANIGNDGNTAIFFGLSGTGKTTLSTDRHRKLIGDDEHGWTDDGAIFNFEGGCYAKVIDLDKNHEPEIYSAIKEGALLENVIMDDHGVVDYTDSSITQNTRVSYPIHFIENIVSPSLGQHPKNIFFLTADAFGVLPPISKLTPEQAAYYFISGYTAKVAGTEEGIEEPQPIFSACFGEPFMPLHPATYGDMLSQKIRVFGSNVWLVNTGWSGGSYNLVPRIKISYTKAMINAAINGNLDHVPYKKDSIFGIEVPQECPSVPTDILHPEATWKDPSSTYHNKAKSLAQSFIDNFEKFKPFASEKVKLAAPIVK